MIAINEQTKSQVDSFSTRPSHALLLRGEQGSGVIEVAEYCIQQLKSNQSQQLVATRIVPDEKGTIGIEKIRELRGSVKHKNQTDGIARVVVITSVEAMQHEAQNALLKLLEEPPIGTMFILLTQNESDVLQTISSRATSIRVLPLSIEMVQNHYNNSQASDIKRMYSISGGLAKLLDDLLHDVDSQEAIAAQRAKDVIGMSLFDRMQLIDKEFKKRDEARLHLASLERVCHAAMVTNPQNDRWRLNIEAVLLAKKRLQANVGSKLVLTELYCTL